MPNKCAWLALRSHILALGTYTLLTFVMTWPIGLRLFTHLAGSGGDMWLFQQNNWWLRNALLERPNPYYATYLFYPQGGSVGTWSPHRFGPFMV